MAPPMVPPMTAPMVPPPVVPHVVAPVAPEPVISLPTAAGYVFPDMVAFQSADNDCQILHGAMRGLGTDERTIINIICSRNAIQRAEIRRRYISLYGKDLIKKLKDELSGNFEDTCVGLFMTPPEYDAYCLYKAMKGIGTNEGVLIEILGTRNNQEIQMIKAEFLKNYGKPLEKWITSETSGHLRKLLVSIIQCNRSMNPVPDPIICQSDAQALYHAGEGRWGTDESTFVRIFTQRSGAELDLISRHYQQLRGNTLHHAIDKEFSGDTKKLLHTILEGIQNPPAYFARRLRESLEGIGTNDSRLVRVIVSRCEIDMPLIKQEYRRLYGRDLLHDVRSDTSGDYKRILTHLIARV
jgi:annexin A7/11